MRHLTAAPVSPGTEPYPSPPHIHRKTKRRVKLFNLLNSQNALGSLLLPVALLVGRH